VAAPELAAAAAPPAPPALLALLALPADPVGLTGALPADPFGLTGALGVPAVLAVPGARPARGGRSRGGATRPPPPPSASAAFLARAEPAPLNPPATRREPELTSPSPSAGGGASGRSRDA
jgi:hypothetical protein